MPDTPTSTSSEAVHDSVNTGIADALAGRSRSGAEALAELRAYAERLKRERHAKAWCCTKSADLPGRLSLNPD